MDITLSYKGNTFLYNVSSLMPISYLRTLAHKSFKIPEKLINLSYQDSNIDKQYNDYLLKEFFKSNHLLINVSEGEQKTVYQNFISNTNISSFKSSKVMKLVRDEKIIKKRFDISLNHEEIKNKEKCQECNKRDIEYFIRESNIFICKICKNNNHSKEKFIILEKGNFKQCGYFYQKNLIEEINNKEKEIKNLIEKSSEERLNKIIEDVYDILDKMSEQERDIMENFPCVSLDIINEIDFSEMKRKIYSINDKIKNKDPYILDGLKAFFQELHNEDCNLDSLRHNIDSVQKKFYFQDNIIGIVEFIRKNLQEFYDSLNSIWDINKNNYSELCNEIDLLIKKNKKNFNFNDIESESENNEITDKDESELEQIIFDNKQLNYNIEKINNNNMSDFVLPKIYEKIHKSQSMFNKYIKDKKMLINNNKIDSHKKLLSDNIINKKKGNTILSESSSSSSSKNDRTNPKKNNNINNKIIFKLGRNNDLNNANGRYFSSSPNKDFQLDKVLLNENKISDSPKRPQRRRSVRMSIFTRNMNKVEPTKLMKVKKKKKKNL